MRFALLAAAFVLAGPVQADPDREDCKRFVGSVTSLSDAARGVQEIFAKSDFDRFANSTNKSLSSAGARANAASEKLRDAMRDYRTATEDLAYQLRVCAR